MDKKLTLGEAEEIARAATQRELEKYELPPTLGGQLVMTTLFEGDDRVFVLYVPGETRDNPNVIAQTRVSLKSGSVNVEVPNLEQKNN